MRWPQLAFLALVWTPFALAAGGSAAAALAAQGGRVSLKLDILAQFAPIWLAGGVLGLAGALLFQGRLRGVLAALGTLAVVASVALIGPEYLRTDGPSAPHPAGRVLKVVQFNVWHDNRDPEQILAWLDAERPDIAVIEENSPAFLAALARHPGWHVGCGRCEVTILSRQAPLSVDSPRVGRRVGVIPLTRAVFRDADGPFEVIGVHNAWPTDIVLQQRQERRLALYTAMAPRERLIVTGDFNSNPWSFSRRRWDRAFGLPRRERGVATWPARPYKRLRWAGLPFLAIDHVYAGTSWATVSVRRGPRLASDHYPLVMTLAPVAPR